MCLYSELNAVRCHLPIICHSREVQRLPRPLSALYIHHFRVHVRIQRKYSWDLCKPSSKECLLMVLEMRSWTHRLSGMQGVMKQVDFYPRECGNMYTEFLMLSSRTGRCFKSCFCLVSSGTCLDSLPFFLVHIGLFAAVSSWNTSPLPVLQFGLFINTVLREIRAQVPL